MTDDNPFAPFTKLLGELDPTGATEAAAMFPLSPFALAGGEAASPEESTKRTVRQLYGILVGLDEGVSTDTWRQLLDSAVFDAPGFTVEKLTGVAESTYRVWFHNLAQLLVESFTIRIVHRELVVDGHRHSTETGRWLWRLPQADREELLLRCTDIDDEVVTEMRTARQHRDDLLYDFGSWGELDIEGSLGEARRHLEVLTALEDHATDGGVFTYLPGDDGA